MLVPVHDYKNNFRETAFHVVGSDGIGAWMEMFLEQIGAKQIKKKKKKIIKKINEGEKNKNKLQ